MSAPDLRSRFLSISCAFATVLSLVSTAHADGGVTYEDIAAGGGAGLVYGRVASPRDALFDAIKQKGTYILPDDIVITPLKPRGSPGVVLFDYDNDGDLDIYVTNGPGAANSLFQNQLSDGGGLTFVDLGADSGAGAEAQDSQGVCFGDIDNDGDEDLYVLGVGDNILYENNGDGTFEDITALSEAGGGGRNGWSCAMGDVDGDGLLDIYVGNAYADPDHQFGVILEPYAFNEPDNLLMNQGDGVFLDQGFARGINTLDGFPPGAQQATLVTALLDFDRDGDMDIITGADQGGMPGSLFGGVDRGLLHVFVNDGDGFFDDNMDEAGLAGRIGGWMGNSFGDLNCDGHIDFFGSNFGQYGFQLFPTPVVPGAFNSRWFLSNGDGTFSDPGVGDLGFTPFGWGSAIHDYDNDGDLDIIFHGGLDVGPFIEDSNPGSILTNHDCSANFTVDTAALAGSTNHLRRTVQGMAAGDLDHDGFVDFVTVSSEDMPEPIPVVPYDPLGTPWDFIASFIPIFVPTQDPNVMVFSGIEVANGTLAVEVSDGANGNHAAAIEVMGTVELASGATTNRSGFGAIIEFTPHDGATSTKPVLGGSSFASQDARAIPFGMGDKWLAQADVIWPGGVRNRLYGIHAGERISFPEIPCSLDAEWSSFHEYHECLKDSLGELRDAGVISRAQKVRLGVSAILAFFDN